MKKKTERHSPEVRERAVRMVLEHQAEHNSQWAAISSIAGKMVAKLSAPFTIDAMSNALRA